MGAFHVGKGVSEATPFIRLHPILLYELTLVMDRGNSYVGNSPLEGDCKVSYVNALAGLHTSPPI